MTCEICGSSEDVVRLSTGLVVCRECFWHDRLSSHFLNKRFHGTRGGYHR